jgi:hypothetical protein
MPETVRAELAPMTKFQDPSPTGRRKPHKRPPSKWEQHKFLCFDGEGYDIDGRHEYVYLCAYNGTDYFELRNENGLSSEACFNFIVDTAAAHPEYISVIFGGGYDAEMMMRDVSVPKLIDIKQGGTCKWRDWRITYVKRKHFTVTDVKRGKTCMLWDVIGFFQCSFEQALKDWLDVEDKTIAKGKRAREAFNREQLAFIIKYCQLELSHFEHLMQRLWEALDFTGIKLNRWDGAGAAAQSVLQQKGVTAYKGSQSSNEEHYLQARCAYAGGRFELIGPGDYVQTVYNYDINSAYPYALSLLPEFTGMRKCKKQDCEYGIYDLLLIEYYDKPSDDMPQIIHPYHHRHESHNVSYPPITVGWHWAIEYINSGFKGIVHEHLHWVDNGVRPFAFIPDDYNYRAELKKAGDKAEKALKLYLNSCYGKTVQQKGWKLGKKWPSFHQLYWGGWVTAYCRSAMYAAMMQAPHSLIAVETDGIFTTEQLDLDIGKGLGQWDCTEYAEMTYLASGVYFAVKPDGTTVDKYRGMDKGQLTREKVLKGWEKYEKASNRGRLLESVRTVPADSTRFRTLGTSLQGARAVDWRQWITETKKVSLMPTGKRIHHPFCHQPWGRNTHHETLPMAERSNMWSHPYNVLWADTLSKLEMYEAVDQVREEDMLSV